MGLLLVVAGVSEVRGAPGVRSVRGAVHHAMYRCQYVVHGTRPPRHGQRHGKGAQEWQLCKDTDQSFSITLYTSSLIINLYMMTSLNYSFSLQPSVLKLH